MLVLLSPFLNLISVIRHVWPLSSRLALDRCDKSCSRKMTTLNWNPSSPLLSANSQNNRLWLGVFLVLKKIKKARLNLAASRIKTVINSIKSLGLKNMIPAQSTNPTPSPAFQPVKSIKWCLQINPPRLIRNQISLLTFLPWFWRRLRRTFRQNSNIWMTTRGKCQESNSTHDLQASNSRSTGIIF